MCFDTRKVAYDFGELDYTCLTRGQRLAMLIGQKKALTVAVALFCSGLHHGGDGAVHAEELVILANDFHQPGRRKCEV